jgi:hypothetical protein
MGVRYQVQAQGLVYTVVDDLTVSQTAVITSALVDEVSGEPLLVEPVITTDVPGLHVNFTQGAFFAVTAYVNLAFPKLATTNYTVDVSVTARGYRPASVTVAIPVAATFPIIQPPIKLRPLSVRVQGRVVKESDRSPIAGATIASGDPAVALLRSTLRFDHPSGKSVNALSQTGPARSLAADAIAGASIITLNNVAGLGATQLLQIGADGSAEIGVISVMGPGATQVTLQNSLRSAFPSTTAVQQLAPGPSVTLARSSNAGDGLLLVSAAPAQDAVQIVDGAQTESSVLNAMSDAAGYYHLNGMTAVVSLNFQCSAAGFTTASKTWFLDYNEPVNVVDFRLKP